MTLQSPSELFLKYDFAVTQDLCKQFITLVTGVLVFSLTFSDKVVKFSRAKKFLRVLVAVSWASMLFAIIACGLGLTYICLAGGQAVYGPENDYALTAHTSYAWIIMAGISFIGGPNGLDPCRPCPAICGLAENLIDLLTHSLIASGF